MNKLAGLGAVILMAAAIPAAAQYPVRPVRFIAPFPPGVGALIHLTGEMFKQAAGIDLTHIPYKGTTQILPDLLDSRVDMALDSLPAYIPHLKAGRVRALAVASRERSSLMPELPTMAEAGVPGVVSATDYALYAPAGTAREIILLLNREINAVLQLPDLREKL